MTTPFRPTHPISDFIEATFDQIAAEQKREALIVEIVAVDTLVETARDRREVALHALNEYWKRKGEERQRARLERIRLADLGVEEPDPLAVEYDSGEWAQRERRTA